MTSNEMRQRVEASAAVSLSLYEGVALGVANATAMLRALPNRRSYPHLLSLNARAFMREHWVEHGLPESWAIGGDPKLMGQTVLVGNDHGVKMRLLKERRRAYPGGVPVAGSNKARRRVWCQLPLDLEIPGQTRVDDEIELLALWDSAQQNGELVVSVRVVHTLAPGKYGERVPIDLSYEIKPTGEVFETLQFVGDSQEEDLFADVSQEENEGGAGVGAVG